MVNSTFKLILIIALVSASQASFTSKLTDSVSSFFSEIFTNESSADSYTDNDSLTGLGPEEDIDLFDEPREITYSDVESCEQECTQENANEFMICVYRCNSIEEEPLVSDVESCEQECTQENANEFMICVYKCNSIEEEPLVSEEDTEQIAGICNAECLSLSFDADTFARCSESCENGLADSDIATLGEDEDMDLGSIEDEIDDLLDNLEEPILKRQDAVIIDNASDDSTGVDLDEILREVEAAGDETLEGEVDSCIANCSQVNAQEFLKCSYYCKQPMVQLEEEEKTEETEERRIIKCKDMCEDLKLGEKCKTYCEENYVNLL